MELVNSYILKFSSLNMGPETLFGLLIIIFLLLYGLSLGRTRALVSLLGIYIAYVLQAIFPYLSELHKAVRVSTEIPGFAREPSPSPEMYLTRIALFFVFYIIIFAILNGSLVKHRMTMKEFSFFWVSFISLLQLGMLLSIVLNFFPSDKLTIFPPSVLIYFGGQKALFGWLLVPVLLLIFMRREKKSRTE